jgi:phosphonate transport system permease protein
VTAPSQVRSRPLPPSHRRRDAWIVATAIVVAWAGLALPIDLADLLELPSGVARVFSEMYLQGGPDWSYLPNALNAMIESLQMAWVGTIIGAAISLPLGFLGAKNVSSGLVSNVVRVILNAIRAFPEIILAIAIFIPIAGLGAVAGALAIGVHSAGTLGKLTAEAIEGIDAGPVEAARATGARGSQVQRWGVLPQVLPELIGFWLYRFEINIRAGAVLGVVGAGGIGFLLDQTIKFGRFPQAGMAILVVIVATIVVDGISGTVRRRVIEGSGGKADETELAVSRLAMGTSDG